MGWVAIVLVACGPSLDDVAGGVGGGGWEPPTDEDHVEGPELLAMARVGGRQQLVAIDDDGAITPYGPPLPGAELSYHMLVWEPDAARGAVLRRSDGVSELHGIVDGELTELGADLATVQWIELSREGHLVVLHHEDASTSVVDHDNELVYALDAPCGGDCDNWLGFGDGDHYVVSARRVDSDAVPPPRAYLVHEFASGQEADLGVLPSSGATFYTLATSILFQAAGDAPDTRWWDLGGARLSVENAPNAIELSPHRYFFRDGRAYEVRDREVVDLGEMPVPAGRVVAFVPGVFAIVEEETSVSSIAPDGRTIARWEPRHGAAFSVYGSFVDPDAPQLLLNLGVSGSVSGEHSLWRPATGETIDLGYEENGPTTLFTGGGTLVRLFVDGSVGIVRADSAEEEMLELGEIEIEGFRYGYD